MVGIALLNPTLCVGNPKPREKTDDLTKKVKSLFSDKASEVELISSFADRYILNYLPNQENQNSVNILYPGSGIDTKQLLIGLKLLHQSPVEEVNYVYTEIGDEDVAYYPEKENLKSNLEAELNKLVDAGLLSKKTVTTTSFDPVVNKGKEQESVEIKYSFDVNTAQGKKTLSLTLAYNRVPDRTEFSAAERSLFGEDFLIKVRANYWPKDKAEGVIYPAYARDEQFDAADIILSRQSGDHTLLQFDCLRAISSPSLRKKQRVVLDEYPSENFAVTHPFPHYKAKVYLLNGSYGYNDKGGGLVVLTPRKGEIK